MSSKACKDRQCTRAGELLDLSEFPRNRKSPDKHYLYCKECCRRRTRARRPPSTRRPREVKRKPSMKAKGGIAFSLVYDAIRKGCRTIKAIQRRTKLSYDEVGEALCELLWVAGAVRIVNREFVPIEEIYLAA